MKVHYQKYLERGIGGPSISLLVYPTLFDKEIHNWDHFVLLWILLEEIVIIEVLYSFEERPGIVVDVLCFECYLLY